MGATSERAEPWVHCSASRQWRWSWPCWRSRASMAANAGVDLSLTHSRDTRLDHKCRSWRPPAGCRQIGSFGTSHARCCLPRRAIETNFIHADFALEGVAPSEARRRLARPRRQPPPTLGAPTTTSDAWAAPATCLSQSRTGANWVMQAGS